MRYQLNSDMGGLKEGGLKDAPAAGHSWTGPYVGVSAGGTGGNTPWTFNGVSTGDSGSVNPDFAGYLAGMQAGYNYQTGRFVLGAEGSYGWSNARGAGHTHIDVNDVNTWDNANNSFEDELRTLGSVTARLGYTFGRALFYAKGGWAFGEVKEGENTISVPGIAPAVDHGSATIWVNGWTAGGGMEYAFTDRWSVKAEYMHFELGEKAFNLDWIGADGTRVRQRRQRSSRRKLPPRRAEIDIAPAGLGYRLTSRQHLPWVIRGDRRPFKEGQIMPVRTSACFCFALASFALVLPNTPALAFEKPAGAVAAPGNAVKASGETREERAERVARERQERCEFGRDECRERQGARREYRRCPETRDCGGSLADYISPAGTESRCNGNLAFAAARPARGANCCLPTGTAATYRRFRRRLSQTARPSRARSALRPPITLWSCWRVMCRPFAASATLSPSSSRLARTSSPGCTGFFMPIVRS